LECGKLLALIKARKEEHIIVLNKVDPIYDQFEIKITKLGKKFPPMS